MLKIPFPFPGTRRSLPHYGKSSLLFGLGLSLCFLSCSPPENADSESRDVQVETTEVEPEVPHPLPPPPLPEMTLVFEFEGIAPQLLDDAIRACGENFRIRQEQLRLDASGSPATRGDLYLLSPRSIPHFITREWVTPLSGEISLSEVNPTFTFHRFDPGNQYSIPYRWTPVVSLLATPENTETASSIDTGPEKIPADPPVTDYLELTSPEIPEEPAARPLQLPDPDFYRETWSPFVTGQVSRIRLPAACPIRNLGKAGVPKWTWSIPEGRTVIFFDHLLLGRDSTLSDKAKAVASYLITHENQSRLVRTSGYFPVLIPLGKEDSASPVALPGGDWFQKSSFITGEPFFPPPPAPPSVDLPPQPTPQTTPQE